MTPKLKQTHTMIAFWVFLILILPVRCYQLLFEMEDGTGYLKTGAVTQYLMPALIILAVLTLCVCALTGKKVKHFYPATGYYPLGVMGIGLALAIAYECGDQFNILSEKMQEERQIVEKVVGAGQLLFAVLAVFLLVIMYARYLVRNDSYRNFRLMGLCFPVWAVFYTTKSYLGLSVVANISENVYDILFLCAVTLFIFSQSKVLAGIGEKSDLRKTVLFGLLTSLLGFIDYIPRQTAVLLGNADVQDFLKRFSVPLAGFFEREGVFSKKVLSDTTQPKILFVVIALYAFVFVLALIRTGKKPDVQEDQADPETAPQTVRQDEPSPDTEPEPDELWDGWEAEEDPEG